MVAATPQAYVATMSKAKRTGKIFIDYFRNDYTATAIADYAFAREAGRAGSRAPRLEGLKTLKSASQFTMKDVLKRVKNKKTRFIPRPKAQRIPS